MSAYRSYYRTLRREAMGAGVQTAPQEAHAAAGPAGAPPPVPARPANSYMVVQDFIASDDDELSLSKGTAVTVTHKYDNGWWLGDYAGMRGCFPYYCVRPRGGTAAATASPAQSPLSQSTEKETETEKEKKKEYVQVQSDYIATDGREMSIGRGQVLLVQRKTESGWWLGTLLDGQLRATSCQGFFPSNYVQPYQPPAPAAQSSGPWMAVAEYEATNGQDLTLRAGQVLQVLAQYPNGWWIGRSSAGTGLFPGSFVRQVSPEEILLLQRRQQQQREEAEARKREEEEARKREEEEARRREAEATLERQRRAQAEAAQAQGVSRAVAVYAYAKQNASELDLAAGSNVTILTKNPSGWWFGESNGARGLFPSNFVRELPAPPPVVRPSRPAAAGARVACTAVAVAAFAAKQPGELGLQPGNVVEVLTQGQQWWLGRFEGITGRFPATAVRVCPAHPSRPPVPSPSALSSPLSHFPLSSPTSPSEHPSPPTFLSEAAPPAPHQAHEDLPDLRSFAEDLRQLEATPTAPKEEQMINMLRNAVATKASAPSAPAKSKLKSMLSGHDTIGRAASGKKNLFDEVGPYEAGMLCPPLYSRAITPSGSFGTRAKVAKELYHTELSYVRCLALLRSAYEEPLRAARGGKAALKAADLDAIFSNAREVLAANLTLLYRFEEAVQAHHANMALACMGSLFFGMKEQFAAYARYAIGYSAAVDVLMGQLKRNGRFKRFLADTAAKNSQCTGQSLQSFLIMPVQRTPRYVLLLQELLKCTPPEHKDYLPLRQAKADMEDVAIFINEEKRQAELEDELEELLAKVEPAQTDLRSGDLLQHGAVALSMDGGTAKKRYLLLFRQAVVVTKKQSDFFGSGMSYAVVTRWPLAKCRWRGESEGGQAMLLGTPQGECCIEAEDSGQLASVLEWKSAFEAAKLELVGGAPR